MKTRTFISAISAMIQNDFLPHMEAQKKDNLNLPIGVLFALFKEMVYTHTEEELVGAYAVDADFDTDFSEEPADPDTNDTTRFPACLDDTYDGIAP